MDSLLKQAQEMYQRLQQLDSELGDRVLEGSSGGGVVRCRINGRLEVVSISIDKAAVDPNDVEGLEDLVLTATRQAVQAANELRQQERDRLTGGVDLPGFGF
ncbi:MAG: YbaB/EbfC family nucleoid-associated protein [Planctomycetota bacterium]